MTDIPVYVNRCLECGKRLPGLYPDLPFPDCDSHGGSPTDTPKRLKQEILDRLYEILGEERLPSMGNAFKGHIAALVAENRGLALANTRHCAQIERLLPTIWEAEALRPVVEAAGEWIRADCCVLVKSEWVKSEWCECEGCKANRKLKSELLIYEKADHSHDAGKKVEAKTLTSGMSTVIVDEALGLIRGVVEWFENRDPETMTEDDAKLLWICNDFDLKHDIDEHGVITVRNEQTHGPSGIMCMVNHANEGQCEECKRCREMIRSGHMGDVCPGKCEAEE